jgi:hypothetical protein
MGLAYGPAEISMFHFVTSAIHADIRKRPSPCNETDVEDRLMKVGAERSGWEAFYADRAERRDAATDEATRQHFEAELEQARIVLQAMGIEIPQTGGANDNKTIEAKTKTPTANENEPEWSASPQEVKFVDAEGNRVDDPSQEIGSPETITNTDGTGPNIIEITNTQDEPIKIGKFKNLKSTIDPSAEIVLQPGETGILRYENGEAGFMAQADADGNYLPTASRLEYQADADGQQKYPDISYIDGRNASISLTDGAGFNKGDTVSIADQAPDNIVTVDSAGNKTITGWYDGSTAQMQAGGAFLEGKLGTGNAYIHPDDDRRGPGQNPMTSTDATVLKATFGEA